MLSEATLGFFIASEDRYRHSDFSGPFDLTVLHGNVFLRDGRAAPHVHVVFNDMQFRTWGGHLIEGRVHVTLEVFLRPFQGSGLERRKIDGQPATKVVEVRGR